MRDIWDLTDVVYWIEGEGVGYQVMGIIKYSVLAHTRIESSSYPKRQQ